MKSVHARILCASIGIAVSAVSLAQGNAKPKPAQVPAPQTKECTNLPRSEWLAEEEFTLLMRHRGYRDFKFKITYQSCYEIYGYDAKGQLVEAYFNPSNAKLNRANTLQVK